MIRLREIEEKDAQYMLEWMHDSDIQNAFKKNIFTATLDDVKVFCAKAKIPDQINNGDNLHFAVVDETDEYLGTISLKDISLDNGSAEYAIAMRKKAHGHGIASEATYLLLEKAFKEYKLHRVYLNVLSENTAAIKLYERCGFTFEGEFREHLKMGGKYVNWKWYGMLEHEFGGGRNSATR